MFESFLGLLRKRRRVDDQTEIPTSTFNNNNVPQATTSSSSSSTSQLKSPSFYPVYNPYLHESTNDSDSLDHTIGVIDRPFNNLNERFVGVLDQLDARVEKFRKDAMGLQEKRDFLLMSIDLIKTNDLLQGMNEAEREEITCYIQRVNSRLSTVELNVRTVRDTSQEDSLSQINMLIDMMITMGDPVLSRQRCQHYLNACGSFDGSINMGSFSEHGLGQDVVVDKKFESALLGCTLDDQKNVKKRLLALMGYLNKQTIRD
ncbi:BAG family molecular chaperone regulator 2 isoform X2 [Episyrphus balteatus]|uniref:BAG family molecular chaperone regulator 2 isoform X2 n=1 Tax=Episyrphus balteatus TaxID=286459 RepID=UPI0024866622|nr:BAG family molecular chaperone regulator 2 isoform X2 [Episyrphus balteatus]